MRTTILVMLIVFATSGCSGDGSSGSKSANGGQTGKPSAIANSLGYPKLYTDANLPQYPGAKLTDTGRQTSSLRDGLKLNLETDDDVQKVSTFFKDEMTKLGWVADKKRRLPAMPVDLTRFTKDDRYFQITVVRHGDGPTKITISYAQN